MTEESNSTRASKDVVLYIQFYRDHALLLLRRAIQSGSILHARPTMETSYAMRAQRATLVSQ